MHTLIRYALLASLAVGLAPAASVMTTRLDDPQAVYLSAAEFGAKGDGEADDSAAIQAAIDKAGNRAGTGILFVPSGRYRLTRTIYAWPGVRIFGYGATRPAFVLGPNTPGFQDGVGVMVMFTGARTGGGAGRGGRGFRIPFPPVGSVPPNEAIADASPGTFYSAMSNIDFEIGEGNPAAIGIRFHAAQHAYLSHMDFHTGSGLAALTEIGNYAQDLKFYGGRYGILTDKPSPAWQFTLVDSIFDGQREAAVREHEAGLTLIRDVFRNAPAGIDIDPEYYDQLWAKDCRFENISRAVVIIGNEKSYLNEIGFDNAVVKDAPTFALFRESGKKVAGKGPIYRVRSFNYGLILPGLGAPGVLGQRFDAAALSSLPPSMPPAIPPLPATAEWTNVRALGAAGDGKTDDTAAIRKAVDAHKVLYFPSGTYLVKDTITLKAGTVLIGLHPLMTRIDVPDGAAGFQGVGAPRAVILAPPGGANLVSGLGVYTGGINPRAVGVLWSAGEASLMDDVRLLGGHGSGSINPYNANQTGDPDPRKRWDGQYPSIWVTNGGGGTFANIWTPSTFAQAGFYASDTRTPGHVYQMSLEHHVRTELKLDRVENWDFNAPQTEEEAGEGAECLSLEISRSKNITIANYHAYRVTRSRAPVAAAVRLYQSGNIHFRNVHVNAESGFATCDQNGCGTFLRASKFPYENAIQDVTHHLEAREREFAVLDVPETPVPPASGNASAVLAPGARVRKLEDGFFSISGAAVDATGKLYFVDHWRQRIYGWSEAEGLTVERDHPLDPVNLAFDKSGALLVLSSAGAQTTVYSFRPGAPGTEMTEIAAQETKPRPGARAILPVNYWNNGEFANQLDFNKMTYTTLGEMFRRDLSAPKAKQYVSPDGSVFLPAARVFQQGPADHTGWRFSDNLDAHGFVSAAPGERVYVSNDSEDVTYRAAVRPDGSLADLQPFAPRGGECVAVDERGNVYVANGQIFVYSPAGKEIGRIDAPERPIDIVFGGKGNRTLFILGHHALYAAQTSGARHRPGVN
ncbi:MAG: SMP-30/gluconolactonase/LRE family protein [Acidobacteriia bacterium]|nr:SMP-30/gluconolactonase/LRE family protein [Terriglobia bacterium]